MSLCFLVLGATLIPQSRPVLVSIKGTAGHFQLVRGGKPYFVKGIGGTDRLELAARNGANSFRTWGADQLDKQLDLAQKNGMTVCAGIWLGHKSYFDYANANQVADQKEMVRKVILAHRSHPALLVWALGNEMETEGNDTPQTWNAIEELAAMVKQLDPMHPVMSVVAECDQTKIDLIKQYAPDLDLLGLNSYGGLGSLAERLTKFGWQKPFLVTEYGNLGPWERPKTAWGAPLELTSSEKAAFLANNYRQSILGAPGQCLGSYAFLWGNKQEETPTWFGMFLPTGEPLEAVEQLKNLWQGKAIAASSPKVISLVFSNGRSEYTGGEPANVKVEFLDSTDIRYSWEVRTETAVRRPDGQGEAEPAIVVAGQANVRGSTFEFNAPSKPGAYRIYVVARNNSPYVATANLTFLVK